MMNMLICQVKSSTVAKVERIQYDIDRIFFCQHHGFISQFNSWIYLIHVAFANCVAYFEFFDILQSNQKIIAVQIVFQTLQSQSLM